MKEIPIIFNSEMVRAILDGRKTQTRRVIKPQPVIETYEPQEASSSIGMEIFWVHCCGINDIIKCCPYGQPGDRLWIRRTFFEAHSDNIPQSDFIYGLTDERIYAIHTAGGKQYERYNAIEWNPIESYSSITKHGLHGGIGRKDLLTNEIQRLWQKGLRGLVSVKGSSFNKEGIPEYFSLPQEQKNNKICSSLGLYGFSWDAPFIILSGSPQRREPEEQRSEQPNVGDTGRKLDGQKSSRKGIGGRKTPDGKTIKQRTGISKMGNRKGLNQPKTCGEDIGFVAGFRLFHCSSRIKKCPSIHMPRWASLINLEITNIRVERVQDISEDDAIAEGVKRPEYYSLVSNYRTWFFVLWDKINDKRGYGCVNNPWVWVIGFRRV